MKNNRGLAMSLRLIGWLIIIMGATAVAFLISQLYDKWERSTWEGIYVAVYFLTAVGLMALMLGLTSFGMARLLNASASAKETKDS